MKDNLKILNFFALHFYENLLKISCPLNSYIYFFNPLNNHYCQLSTNCVKIFIITLL